MSFSQYASKLMASTANKHTHQPLFYSAYDYDISEEEDHQILGQMEPATATSLSLSVESTATGTATKDKGKGRASGSIASSMPRQAYPSSRLWERSEVNAYLPFGNPFNGISRGWRAHESTTADVYRERERGVVTQGVDEDYSDDGDDGDRVSEASTSTSSPPEFLATPHLHLHPSLAQHDLTEPLISPSTVYVYPCPPRTGANSLAKYENPSWIAIYFISLAVIFVLLLTTPSRLPSPGSPLPALIPILGLLSLLSILAGVSCLAYFTFLTHLIRPLIRLLVISAPVGFGMLGMGALYASFGTSGVESDSRWRLGMKLFGLGCWFTALILVRSMLGSGEKRSRLDRSVRVIELASSIVVLHPQLFLLCISLSLLGTMVTLPFLSLLVSLPPSSTYTIVYTTSIWIWTLTVIRNIQRVAVAGVVGGWYFRRHETDYMNDHVQGGAAAKGVGGLTFESTRRAVGTSLGTVLLASAVTSVFTLLQVVLNSFKRGVKSALSAQSRSTSFVLGVILTPLEMLIPVINILKGFVEMFNGWGLVYTGLTGEGYASSCRKSRDLLRGNRTVGLGDNLLVKFILYLTSTLLSLFAGFISFLILSSSTSPSPTVKSAVGGGIIEWIGIAALCALVPFWCIRLCGDILGDSCDTLFVAWNIDLSLGVDHCAKANEAFGTIEGEEIAV